MTSRPHGNLVRSRESPPTDRSRKSSPRFNRIESRRPPLRAPRVARLLPLQYRFTHAKGLAKNLARSQRPKLATFWMASGRRTGGLPRVPRRPGSFHRHGSRAWPGTSSAVTGEGAVCGAGRSPGRPRRRKCLRTEMIPPRRSRSSCPSIGSSGGFPKSRPDSCTWSEAAARLRKRWGHWAYLAEAGLFSASA